MIYRHWLRESACVERDGADAEMLRRSWFCKRLTNHLCVQLRISFFYWELSGISQC